VEAAVELGEGGGRREWLVIVGVMLCVSGWVVLLLHILLLWESSIARGMHG